VLKWIVDRVNEPDKIGAKETPLGFIPQLKDLYLDGLDIPKEKLEKLFEVDIKDWGAELTDVKNFLEKFGENLPEEMWDEYNKIKG